MKEEMKDSGALTPRDETPAEMSAWAAYSALHNLGGNIFFDQIPPEKISATIEAACKHMRSLLEGDLPAIRETIKWVGGLMDDADGALDKDTYDEMRRLSGNGDLDLPDDCEISIQVGTRRKCNALFNAIAELRRAALAGQSRESMQSGEANPPPQGSAP